MFFWVADNFREPVHRPVQKKDNLHFDNWKPWESLTELENVVGKTFRGSF